MNVMLMISIGLKRDAEREPACFYLLNEGWQYQ